jgi:signal transduction histidine kinase
LLNNNSNSSNGAAAAERTEIFRDSKTATEAILRFVSKATTEINACLDAKGPSVMLEVKPIKKARLDAKRRGVKFRYITEITKDNIDYCKGLLEFVDELRHLNGIKGNFELCDKKEYIATATLQKAQPIDELIHSNVRQIVEQEQFVFDTFWSKAVPSKERIREIEEGIELGTMEIITDPCEAQKIERILLASAKQEILLIYSTVNAFYIQDSVGITQFLSQLAENGVKVRLIAATNPSINNAIQDLKLNSNISIRDIEPNATTTTIIKFKCLVVDKKYSLVMELRDDSKESFVSAIGLSTYSNSAPTVLSYVSIFETLWRQTEVNQQLKQSDSIKNEFINIAAHELRTPIMPIVAGIEMIEDKLGDKVQEIMTELKIVDRNAARLEKLAEDILQVSRIESGTFQINGQNEVDIGSLILDVIKDVERKYQHTDKKDKVSILFSPEPATTTTTTADNRYLQDKNNNRSIMTTVLCDRPKITEVLFNLIDNAMKFTEYGSVSIYLKVDHSSSSPHPYPDNHSSSSSYQTNDSLGGTVTVSVTDTGTGIDASIKNKLFEKFITTSNRGGTGLGLYISKKIVEAHDGKIWADNNSSDGKVKGATFTFSLPIKKREEQSLLHDK